jgi:hypothetical protein
MKKRKEDGPGEEGGSCRVPSKGGSEYRMTKLMNSECRTQILESRTEIEVERDTGNSCDSK